MINAQNINWEIVPIDPNYPTWIDFIEIWVDEL